MRVDRTDKLAKFMKLRHPHDSARVWFAKFQHEKILIKYGTNRTSMSESCPFLEIRNEHEDPSVPATNSRSADDFTGPVPGFS